MALALSVQALPSASQNTVFDARITGAGNPSGVYIAQGVAASAPTTLNDISEDSLSSAIFAPEYVLTRQAGSGTLQLKVPSPAISAAGLNVWYLAWTAFPGATDPAAAVAGPFVSVP